MTKCMVMSCDEEAVCRGMCQRHYLAWWRKTPRRDRTETTPRPPERHAELVGLFGGVRPFCRAVGIDPTTYYRWGDTVPAEMKPAIADGAVRAGKDVGAVMRALGEV